MTIPCTIHKERTVNDTAYDLAMQFGKEAQKHFPDSYVYLFGSHAKGCPGPGSDIDVAVIIGHIEGCKRNPFLALDAGNLIYNIGAIDFDPVEAHLIQADFSENGFLGTILNTGIQLLEPAKPIKCWIAKLKRCMWAMSPRSSEEAKYRRLRLEPSDFLFNNESV